MKKSLLLLAASIIMLAAIGIGTAQAQEIRLISYERNDTFIYVSETGNTMSIGNADAWHNWSIIFMENKTTYSKIEILGEDRTIEIPKDIHFNQVLVGYFIDRVTYEVHGRFNVSR